MSNSSQRFVISSNPVQAEARALEGRLDGDFRIKSEYGNVADVMTQNVIDYYQRKVNETKRGEHKPTKLRQWKSVETHYSEFMLSRIAPNFKMFNRSSSHQYKMALIPFTYTAPHPTLAERETYMSRWNEDGDLYIAVMAECRKYKPTGTILFTPEIVTSHNPKSLLMLVLNILVV